jgi:cytochrome oxidase Cu insertion factor (SCO1/SenC/PrrC family)
MPFGLWTGIRHRDMLRAGKGGAALRRGMARAAWSLAAAAALAISAGAWAYRTHAARPLPGTALGGAVAPDFTLTDESGRPQTLSAWRGRVVVLAFVDSRCTTVCPLTALAIQQAQQLLGPRADQVQFLAVNTNPLFTSTRDTASWSAEHGMQGRWLFLTGSLQQLEPVWRAYGIASQMIDGVDAHTPAVYVIDRQGREQRLLFSGQDVSVGVEARDLATVVAALLR